MSDLRYHDAVQAIKAAILQSQYDAARSVNEKQLLLYYGIGKYIAQKSRKDPGARAPSKRSAPSCRLSCRG